MFLAGMIVGAVLGKWGVGALLVAFAALKFAPKAPKPDDGDDPIEHIPDSRPFGSKPKVQVKRKRPTIFGR
jgi:hypothetical protein